ncbi:CoA-binding protein [Sphingobacterium sp. FBM7-1]|uniref:CoA-binding protein n=1 Tax=Sphingobacterium sp. FBM7-1 TaxID=2886688 RepID=UPI001D106181|nr:CoA-binding protein [Sphingobacterium sp. FBM7-1]MCC2599098.1 CoA-binding protein [Sphingobacterium sp. FBM7-1]
MKKTLIVGASNNPARYAYLVANKLVRKGYPIVNVGRKKGKVAGVEIEDMGDIHMDIDTITLYVGPQNQAVYYDYILQTKPKRVIFNPGTENEVFKQQLEASGIEAVEACTLVMLNTEQY